MRWKMQCIVLSWYCVPSSFPEYTEEKEEAYRWQESQQRQGVGFIPDGGLPQASIASGTQPLCRQTAGAGTTLQGEVTGCESSLHLFSYDLYGEFNIYNRLY